MFEREKQPGHGKRDVLKPEEVATDVGIKRLWLLKAAGTPAAPSRGSAGGRGKLAAVSPSWTRASSRLASQPRWATSLARAPAARAQGAAATPHLLLCGEDEPLLLGLPFF